MTRTASALSLVLVFGLLLVGSLLLLLPSGRESRPGSVLSSEPDGRRALLLLLDELGFDARAWTEVPARLPHGGATLFLDAVPPEPLRASQDSWAQRDMRHYRRFVEQGGALFVPASQEMIGFFEEDLRFDEVGRVPWTDGRLVSRAYLSGSEECTIRWTPDRLGSSLISDPGARFLASTVDGAGLAVAVALGRGTLVLLAPGEDPWSNKRLSTEEHALLCVRLLESVAPSRSVLFDEYVLGGWAPDSPMELAFSPQSFVFSLHLFLFALFALWTAVWVRSFPRDAEPLAAVSALARARSFAGLLERAGRSDLLAAMLAPANPNERSSWKRRRSIP